MKAFLEEYGFAILATIIVILIIMMISPVGISIRESLRSVVFKFDGSVQNGLDTVLESGIIDLDDNQSGYVIRIPDPSTQMYDAPYIVCKLAGEGNANECKFYKVSESGYGLVYHAEYGDGNAFFSEGEHLAGPYSYGSEKYYNHIFYMGDEEYNEKLSYMAIDSFSANYGPSYPSIEGVWYTDDETFEFSDGTMTVTTIRGNTYEYTYNSTYIEYEDEESPGYYYSINSENNLLKFWSEGGESWPMTATRINSNADFSILNGHWRTDDNAYGDESEGYFYKDIEFYSAREAQGTYYYNNGNSFQPFSLYPYVLNGNMYLQRRKVEIIDDITFKYRGSIYKRVPKS